MARARLFEERNQSAELRVEAARLADDLGSGRWPLTAPVYHLCMGDALRWAGLTPEAGAPEREVLADAAQELWQKRATRGSSGNAVLSVAGQPVAGGPARPTGLRGGGLWFAVHPDGRHVAFVDGPGVQEEVVAIKNLLPSPKPVR